MAFDNRSHGEHHPSHSQKGTWMATPGQLVSAVSAATGVPAPTIADIDRRLVRAGLRTSSGRGLSAAKMSAYDAANLLIGALVGLEGSATAELVRAVGDLKTQDDPDHGVHEQTWQFDWVPGPRVVPVGEHTLRDFIASLLQSARDGSLQAAMKNGIEAAALASGSPEHLQNDLWLVVSMNALDPRPYALATFCLGFGESVRYGFYQNRGPGLNRDRSIGLDVILAVGNCLADREPSSLSFDPGEVANDAPIR